MSPPMTEPLTRFEALDHALAQLQEFGLEVDHLDTTGTIVRVHHRDDKPGRKNGWYVARELTTARGAHLVVGAYGSWKQGDHSHQLAHAHQELSAEERRALAAERKAIEAAARAERARNAQEAARRAEKIWGALSPEVDRPNAYLARKQVAALGVRMSRDTLVIPLRTAPEGPLVGLQFIDPSGSKRFLTGTAKRGAFHALGPIAAGSTVLIAEGYATSATLQMATGITAVVAFDAGNLGEVARVLLGQWPDLRVIFCADDDHATTGNPGVLKATAAARAHRARLAVPVFSGERGSDWNDLHVLEGLEAVRAQWADLGCVTAPPADHPERGATAEDSSAVQPRDGDPTPPPPLDPQDPGPWAGADAPPPGRPNLRVVGGTEHDPRPVIQIRAGELPECVDDAEHYLIKARADIFQHGTRLVRVGRWDAETRGPIARPHGAGVLIDISPEWLTDHMTRVIRWERWDSRKGELKRVDCPSKIASTLLSRVGEWRFPGLVGFCDSPTLTLEGRVVAKPGFDQESGLYLSHPPAIGDVGMTDRHDAERGAEILCEAVATFPFVTESDRSACLALLMTAIFRRILPAAPIGGVSANTPGTGKSKLVDLISVVATGRPAPVVAIGSTPEELEKRVDSILLKGDTLASFDNVDRAVKSDILCQIATQSTKSIRVMGLSKIVESPTNVCVMMTGNNLTLVGDLVRRCLMVYLDAGVERPELRVFESDAVLDALAKRGELIRAAILISKAYIDAGCPKVDAPPFGSFETWDRLIRRALIWAGMPDPLKPAEAMREQDHELAGMRDLLREWERIHPSPLSAADLLDLTKERVANMGEGWSYQYPALTDAAVQVFGDLNRITARDVAYRLRAMQGRLFESRRVAKTPKGKQGVRWFVENCATDSAPLATPSASRAGPDP